MIKQKNYNGDDIFAVEEKLAKAFIISSKLHQSKIRKVSGAPYISHLVSTMLILRHENKDILAACLLADALSCSEYSYQQLCFDFDMTIAQIVKEISLAKEAVAKAAAEGNQSYENGWRKRKKLFLKHLPQMSEAAKLILTAKHIHNLLSLIKDYQDQGEEVWIKLRLSRRTMLDYYQNFFIVLTASFYNPILGEYYQVFKEIQSVFSVLPKTKARKK